MATIRDLVQRCDTGDTDAFTTGDAGASYVATISTRPFFLSGLLNRHGIMAAMLHAKAVVGSIVISLVRDFGLGTPKTVIADLTSAQDVRIAKMDALSMAELTAVQITFEDDTVPVEWELHQFALKPRPEQTA